MSVGQDGEKYAKRVYAKRVVMEIKRYNIALLSIGRPEAYIQIANLLFKPYAQSYLLGPDSLPHITLCQFLAQSSNIFDLIPDLEHADQRPPVHLTGLRFSNKHHSNLWGASLSVKRSPELMKLQAFVVDLLSHHRLSPLNPVGELYVPHLTLARVNCIQVKNFPKDIFIDDLFNLALGDSDELGQFTKILHLF